MSLPVIDEHLDAVELEQKVWDVDEPHADANLRLAIIPLIFDMIIEMQSCVAVAQEAGCRIVVHNENNSNESRNQIEYSSESIYVQKPRVPRVHLECLVLHFHRCAIAISPGLNVCNKKWQLENYQARQTHAD